MLGSDDGLDFFGSRAPRKRRRWLRVLPSVVCVLGAGVLMAMIGDADVDLGNLWAIPALALVITAATLPAWWRGGSGDPMEGEAKRILRLHWRMHLRAAIVLVYVALVFLWIASYAHYEGTDQYDTTNSATDAAHYNTYSTVSMWIFIAAAVVMVIAPLTWRLWPARVRVALRQARRFDGGYGGPGGAGGSGSNGGSGGYGDF